MPSAHPAHNLVVVAAVEMEGLDVEEEATLGYGVEGGREQEAVVAVGGIDCPADGDPPVFGGD